VVAGGVARQGLAFAPYDDRRFLDDEMEGTLGLDFFRPYVVAADWHHERFHLTPRQGAQAARELRLGRWGQAICVACVHVEVVPGADPRPILRVSRDRAEGDLELVLAAAPAGPSGSELPALEVDLPAGAPGVEVPLEPRYAGVALSIVDASPFPRRCPHGGACVLTELPPVP